MTASSIQRILETRDSSIPKDSLLGHLLPDSYILDVSHIPRQSGLLSNDEIIITENYTACQLVTQLAQGQLAAEQVIKAYLKRAGIAHQLTNCATEFLGKEAIDRAKYLDEEFKKRGGPVGPLHGLPISLKDYITMKERRTSAGYIKWIDRIAKNDALILKILYEAGAIFFVRTTQPQSLMHLECSSPVYGTTVNPFNRNLTCGGSTGGEGALLGLKGSPMGIGTDIGGSVRSPAANNGIYGLKPTSFRIPKQGIMGVQIGRESIIGVIGPLTRAREDINLFMKIILDSEPWLQEPSLVPIPWRSITLYSKNLTVAVLWDDGVVRPHPPITRALHETVEHLKKSGIRVINWEPIDHQKSWDLISALYYCNGAQEERSMLKEVEEPLLPLTEWIFNQPQVKTRNWTEMNELIGERDNYRNRYAQIWNEREVFFNCSIDCLLTPVGPSAAPQHNTAKWWGYTSIWNLLDYPAAVFPVRTVDLIKDQVEINYEPRNILDDENYRLYASPQSYANAPIGLQVVCRRYNDEKVMKCVELIEQSMGRE
jgi:Asp-tRNA(Asn)/Glu-tRNA(Gln) amidotransferase A subunit family amidase